jgi:hypothetical protein
MSVAVFQASMARLVIDRRFRERVARAGERALPGTLSSRERERVRAAASHPGLDITRMMYVSFRLSRLQAALPYTFRLLGRKLDDEVSLYLERRRPASFYFVDEGRALLAHLRARMRSGALAIPYLADVVSYEGGLLALQEARNRGADTAVTVLVKHDLEAIMRALDAGRLPRRIASHPTKLIGRVTEGEIQFRARPALVRRPARSGERMPNSNEGGRKGQPK